MTNFKSNLKKILSFVLAIVMLVGIVPIAFKFDADVKAETTELVDSLENGFVQGPNDAVIIHDKSLGFGSFGSVFKGNLVKGAGVYDTETQKNSTQAFDRIIIVFVFNRTMGGSSVDMAQGFEGTENLVWTSKCTIQYPENVWRMSSSTVTKENTHEVGELIDKSSTNYIYFQQQNGDTTQLNSKRLKLGCNMTLDYITIKTNTSTVAKYPALDCNSFDLKIGANVNFLYADDATSRFIIYNSAFKSGADSIQNIEVLSGEWIAVAPYPATEDCTQKLTGTINVSIGDGVTVINTGSTDIFGGMFATHSLFANADLAETAVINYNIGDVNFSTIDDMYVLGGRRMSTAELYESGTAPVAAGTINLNLTNTKFLATLNASQSDSSNQHKKYVVEADDTGLRVNVTANLVSFADGKKLSLDSSTFGGDNADYVTTTVYAHTSIHDSITADNVHSIDSAACIHDSLTAIATGNAENRSITLSCNLNKYTGCDFSLAFDADLNGLPVVYIDMLRGNDDYFGESIATAVKSFDRAVEVLSKWNVGGTFVIVDDSNTREFLEDDAADLKINSVGGPLTITASTVPFLGDKGRDFGSILLLFNQVWFYNDTTFNNITLAVTKSARGWYLRYNDLTVEESVVMKDLYSYTLGKRPEVYEELTRKSIAIITGFRPSGFLGGSDNVITYRKGFGDQHVALLSGNYNFVRVGNYEHASAHTALEPKVDWAGLGHAYIYVGSKVDINTINTITDKSRIHPFLTFADGKNYSVFDDGSSKADEGVTVYMGNEVEHTAATGGFTYAPTNISYISPEHITKINSSIFDELTTALKPNDGDGKVSVRVTVDATDDIDFVTDESKTIKEFGILFKKQSAGDDINYFTKEMSDTQDTTKDAYDNMGKSVAYPVVKDENGELKTGYYYTGETLKFSGILEFDPDAETGLLLGGYETFVAYPYIVFDGDTSAIVGSGSIVSLDAVLNEMKNSGIEADVARAKEIREKLASASALVEVENVEDIPEDYLPDPAPSDVPKGPTGSKAYFSPAAITEDLNAMVHPDTAFTISGSKGISSIQTNVNLKADDSTDLSVTKQGTSGNEFVRFFNKGDYTYSQLVLNLDPDIFERAADLELSFTFKLCDSFGCTDPDGRAVVVRTYDSAGKLADYPVVTKDNLFKYDYTNWTTVNFPLSPVNRPIQIAIIIFANPDEYIDIKSLAVFGDTTMLELADPAGSIAYFDPARLPENFAGAMNDSGCTGITKLETYSGTKATTDVDADGTEYVRIKALQDGNSYFDIYFDSTKFTAGGTYYFTITYRLSEGYKSTDSSGRALQARLQPGTVQKNLVLTKDLDPENDPTRFTGWTTETVSHTFKATQVPTYVRFYLFSTFTGCYVDIKSMAIYDKDPATIEPDSEPEFEILEAPLGAIGFLNPSAINENVNVLDGVGTQVTLSGAKGITALNGQTQSSANILVAAELKVEDGVKFLRYGNDKNFVSGNYNWLHIALDSNVFTEVGQYYFTITYRISENYESTSTNNKAFFARFGDGDTSFSDYVILSDASAEATEWTTVTFSIERTIVPKFLRLIMYSVPGSHVDIKSLAIHPTDPTNSAELEALSYKQQFAPGDITGDDSVCPSGTDFLGNKYGTVGTFNYCPSIIIDDDGFAYMYYCTNSGYDYDLLNLSGVEDHIGCRKGTTDGKGGYTWGDEVLVLSPSNRGWDNQNVCDPSVIKGNFTYNGKSYTYLMAYLGAANGDNAENEIGFAVSNYPMKEWERVGTAPVVDAPAFDKQLAETNKKYNQWGKGQPSLVTVGEEVYLFYTHGIGEGENTIRYVEVPSDLTSVDLSGENSILTSAGLVGYNGAADTEINNADFMYDPETNVLYMVGESHPWVGSKDYPSGVSKYFRIAYISADELEGGTWTMIGNFKDADSTYIRSHNAGFLRDAYGHLPANAEFLGVYYTVASLLDEDGSVKEVSNNNDTLNSYRIHNYFRVLPEITKVGE